ncbi:hypothetical protein SUDANB171_01703 [Streptomyces sp. enrichment culture]|jgi:hypothetical protein|uniref:hypothetical protein n=1 Tax=Streptomyces sp. enrichment culture TaxID=1795815 RepID=UPI003F54A647
MRTPAAALALALAGLAAGAGAAHADGNTNSDNVTVITVQFCGQAPDFTEAVNYGTLSAQQCLTGPGVE